MNSQLSFFEEDAVVTASRVVNVASVPQRSPFRYPGGKTWLIPVVRKWLKQSDESKVLVEPFAGGGIVSLTVAFESLAERITMVELDPEVAAVWEVVVNGNFKWLADEIYSFDLTPENAKRVLEKRDKSVSEQAFSTILKNRIFHGGIIAKGSGVIKNGENGKGIRSRWYPRTLRDRINAIGHVRDRISFVAGDAFEELEKICGETNVYSFIDPPYTLAGKRLYTHYDIDHDALFNVASRLKGRFMMTYDDTEEIRDLAVRYHLDFRTIPMKTTHHIQKNEIIVSDNFEWWD